MSEKICVTGYGQTVYFKKPTFDYAQMCIGSDNLIHGQVLNTNQDKWKLKKWNKETGKVIGSERSTATYFDLVPVDVGVISESPKVCDGRWDGYYIEASQEAVDLLIADGYKDGELLSTLQYGIQQNGLFLINNSKVTWCHRSSMTGFDIINNNTMKPLYIVDGKFSQTQYHPDKVIFSSSRMGSIPDAFTIAEDKSFIVGTQYKHLKCDTVEWSKQNHTLEQQKAICQFMINKYSMRDKGQDSDDIVKIKFYVNWLEEIVKS